MNTTKYRPGGVKELLVTSIPIMLSQASSSLMMFTDRYLLKTQGKIVPASSMAGGFLALLFSIFFFGLLTYTTPLVAQYLGANKKNYCPVIATQGFSIALAAAPCLMFAGYYLAPYYFDLVGIIEEEKALALKYFNIMNCFTLFPLLNVIFAGFFSGIKRTNLVMYSNLTAMIINIPLTYFLIHHGIMGYFKGIEGAALATGISTVFIVITYAYFYFSKENVSKYLVLESFYFDRKICKKLLHFGLPTAVEFFLIFFAFNTFVALFHSYGSDEALAITITFNWDIIAFLPLWGLNIGIMSLTGTYMGAKQVEYAKKTTYSGAIIAYSLIVGFSFVFVFFTHELVQLFVVDELLSEDSTAIQLAHFMLQTVSIYCFAEATNMVFSATLRAAGDTKWCMYASIFGHWSVLLISFATIKIFHWPPSHTWLILVVNYFILAGLFAYRYFVGKWQGMSVVHG